jgi:hypothetical protein
VDYDEWTTNECMHEEALYVWKCYKPQTLKMQLSFTLLNSYCNRFGF